MTTQPKLPDTLITTLRELYFSNANMAVLGGDILRIAQKNNIDLGDVYTINYIAIFVEEGLKSQEPLCAMYWDKQGYSRSVARSLAKIAFGIKGDENTSPSDIDFAMNSKIQEIEDGFNEQTPFISFPTVGEGYIVHDLRQLTTAPKVGRGYLTSDFNTLADIWTIIRVQESTDGQECALYLERYKASGKIERKVVEAVMPATEMVYKDIVPFEG